MELAAPEVAQRWPGPPTSPVKAVWPSEAPQLQFAGHGSAGGTVALHRIQVGFIALMSTWDVRVLCLTWSAPHERILEVPQHKMLSVLSQQCDLDISTCPGASAGSAGAECSWCCTAAAATGTGPTGCSRKPHQRQRAACGVGGCQWSIPLGSCNSLLHRCLLTTQVPFHAV